ncbi:hypothetical protein F4809DRAFT_614161 [Biscogniauxia mediterranea]|nr:hypothetical protein F4809DRAFT_614161 [Biscogniauxia mediterranea]
MMLFSRIFFFFSFSSYSSIFHVSVASLPCLAGLIIKSEIDLPPKPGAVIIHSLARFVYTPPPLFHNCPFLRSPLSSSSSSHGKSLYLRVMHSLSTFPYLFGAMDQGKKSATYETKNKTSSALYDFGGGGDGGVASEPSPDGKAKGGARRWGKQVSELPK